LPGAAEHPDYPRVLMVVAYEALDSGNQDRANVFCRQALQAVRDMPNPPAGPPLEIDALTLQAEASLASGDYSDAVVAYTRAAKLATANGYTGIAAIFLAYSVTSDLLGGGDPEEATARAEQSMASARHSRLPGAIVIALNALALALVDSDPERARTLLQESVQRSITPDQEIAPGFVTASLVAGRLREWELTLTLGARAMYMYRGIMNPLHSAPCFAGCARALAEGRPEVASVLLGATYTAFQSAMPAPRSGGRSRASQVGTGANFLFQALRETGDLVASALGEERARELRRSWAAMGLDEAVSYALSNIDAKLLAGPVTFA
jgi:hypothetical protein